MRIYQVDAFTDQPFKGNPAGVCMLESPRPDEWMRSVAMEMNLSETAFLLQHNEGFELRWFTPKREVNLCGHATLATAHVLWEDRRLEPGQEARFNTKSGLLLANKDGAWIALDFPVRLAAPTEQNSALNQALGIDPLCASKLASDRGDTYLLEEKSETIVRSMTPDFGLLQACGVRSVIVTSRSDDAQYDFVSRYFAPGVGVNEDPVTGSAHCCLAPYWGTKLGKKDLVGLQVSQRTGVVQCRWAGDRVILRGQAITILKGELFV